MSPATPAHGVFAIGLVMGAGIAFSLSVQALFLWF